jgi:hypothetical protein
MLAVIAWFTRAGAARKEVEGSRRLAEAQRVVQSGNLALAQSDLQRVVQQYKGTPAEIQGRMLLAQVLFDQQKVEEGLAVLREGNPSGATAAAYEALIAAGLEQANKPAEAAAAYGRAALAAQSDVEKQSYMAESARAFEAAGNTDEARRIWGELAADESQPMSAEAKLRLGELTAKAAAKG